MFEPTVLNSAERKQCGDTISSNAFYLLVADALLRRRPLSVVRMGDGEKLLMDMCEGIAVKDPPRDVNDEDWMGRLGCLGIDKDVLYGRLNCAANECDWFAPSVSGIIRSDFNLYDRFRPRPRYVDNFFVNSWTDEMKINLYKAAGHILFIHRNPESFDALHARAATIGVKASYIRLERWQQADEVIDKAAEIDASLVLFSAGPASKYIGHRISRGGNILKVSLDLGNSSDQWLLYCLHQNSTKE